MNGFLEAVQAIPWQTVGFPLAVLFGSMVAGLVISLVLARRSDESVVSAGRRVDLELSRVQVLEQLRALEQERGKIDDAEYAREHQNLLARGAAAMRALDEESHSPEPATREVIVDRQDPDKLETPPGELLQALGHDRERLGNDRYLAILALLEGARPVEGAAASTAPSGRLSPRWEGALWTLGICSIIAGLYFFIASDSQGEMITERPQMEEAEPPQVLAWRKALDDDPNDLDALLDLATYEMNRRRGKEAFELLERAIEVNPKDARVRAAQARMLFSAGKTREAVTMLDDTLADHPESAVVLFYRGAFSAEPDDAVRYLERALEYASVELAPAIRQTLSAVKDEQKRRATALPVISGTLDVPEGTEIPEGAVLFISVKNPGGSGPPLFTSRLPAASFPVSFALTTANSMTGQKTVPSTGMFRARIDLDGNATTREDAPSFEQDGLTLPTEDLNITLQ